MPTKTNNPQSDLSDARRILQQFGLVVVVVTIFLVAWFTYQGISSRQDSARNVATMPIASPTTADLTTLIAANKAEIAREIASLKLNCIDIPYCPVFNEMANNIPVFVDGLDQNMFNTLKDWGYHDQWSDNHGKSFSSFGSTSPTNVYWVAGVKTDANPISTGPAYQDQENYPNAGLDNLGVIHPWPGGQPWIITWTLYNSGGQIVRQLTYTAQTLPIDPNLDNNPAVMCDLRPISRACALNALVGTPNEFRIYDPPPAKPYIPVPTNTSGN